MKEIETGHILLEEIASLSSEARAGRLQITAVGSRGAFFFNQGKLVEARMGPFTIAGGQPRNFHWRNSA